MSEGDAIMVRTLSTGLSLSPTWLRESAWRRTDSRAEEMFDLAFFSGLARDAEGAGVDFLFAPDAAHLDPSVLDEMPGFSTLDSHTLVSALAGLTSRIGLVPTVHTAYDAPFSAARRIQSLHRLSDGRAGWNAVTALGGSGNFGLDRLPDSAERYARAAEFVDVVTGLWAGYPAEAFLVDREAGRYADAGAVRELRHAGEFFRVEGAMTMPSHPSGPPPLFQAGASSAGLDFAARTADAVFGVASDTVSARTQRAELRDRAAGHGRAPGDIRFLPGLSLVLGDTRDEAAAFAEGGSGGRPHRGPGHWSVVGTADDAVAAVVRWADADAIDGFIALPGGSWRSIELFLSSVMPALVERGYVREGYAGTTLRENLGM